MIQTAKILSPVCRGYLCFDAPEELETAGAILAEKDYRVMRQWYDGYYVGGIHAYNPKSVMESILRNKNKQLLDKAETYEALRDYIDLNFDGLKDAGPLCLVERPVKWIRVHLPK